MAKSILDVMNGERKAVNANVPPLVWNNTAAAHAKAWVEYLRQARQAARSSTVSRCQGGNKLNHARIMRVRTSYITLLTMRTVVSRLPQLLALRKEGLSRGTAVRIPGDRSLHTDSLEYHEIRRLRNRGPATVNRAQWRRR